MGANSVRPGHARTESSPRSPVPRRRIGFWSTSFDGVGRKCASDVAAAASPRAAAAAANDPNVLAMKPRLVVALRSAMRATSHSPIDLFHLTIGFLEAAVGADPE